MVAGPDMSPEEKTERFCAGDLFDAENTVQNDAPVLSRVSEASAENQFVKDLDEKGTPYNIPDHIDTYTCGYLLSTRAVSARITDLHTVI
jgi:hypothetical protein